MKKLTAIILALATVICLFAACGKKQETLTFENYQYVLEEDGTAKITKYLGEAQEDELVIPVTLGEGEGAPTVSAIGESAFEGSQALVKVSMPYSLIKIEKRAFAGSSISRLHMESCAEFKEIGAEAFKDCAKLVQVDMKAVETIGKDAFASCVALMVFTVRTDAALSMDSFTDAGKFKMVLHDDCAQLIQFAKDNGYEIQTF